RWHRIISSATSYWLFPPVPLSPMRARRTDFGFSGSFNSAAGADSRLARTGMKARLLIFITLGNNIANEIDDQISLDIPQNQIVPDHPVFNLGRQRRQV